MDQLSSLDATFIQAETSNLPMHVSAVSIYDQQGAPGGPIRFKDIMRLYEDAIYDIPLLRRRLVEVPGNLDYPYWIEDPDFDIEFHIRHIALPQPGDWRQFYIQVSRLHSRQLDLARPLWEIYVIEGLNHLDGIQSGSFAIMQKLHHAAVDGSAVQDLFLSLHDFEAKQHEYKQRKLALVRETEPSRSKLLLRSWQRSLQRPGKLTRTLSGVLKNRKQLDKAMEEGDIIEQTRPQPCRFNGEISPHRVVTSTSFDFAEFKKLSKQVDNATINDLALCVLGSAINLYLKENGDKFEAPLVAQVPVNIRDESDNSGEGNKIAPINISTCSDITDIKERLAAIAKASSSAKLRLETLGSSLSKDMAEALGPRVTKTIFTALGNSSKIQSYINLMPSGPNFALSNMPGPPVPVYLCGAQLVWGIGLGPLMPDMGLFITANSSNGRFILGVTACRNMMPDPEHFQQCLQRAYDECKQALLPSGESKEAKAKTGAKTRSKAKAKPKTKPKTKAKAKTKTKTKAKAKAKAKVKAKSKVTGKPKAKAKTKPKAKAKTKKKTVAKQKK